MKRIMLMKIILNSSGTDFDMGILLNSKSASEVFMFLNSSVKE
jgi:hypothetical protein